VKAQECEHALGLLVNFLNADPQLGGSQSGPAGRFQEEQDRSVAESSSLYRLLKMHSALAQFSPSSRCRSHNVAYAYRLHFLPTSLTTSPREGLAREEQDAFGFDRDPDISVGGHWAFSRPESRGRHFASAWVGSQRICGETASEQLSCCKKKS